MRMLRNASVNTKLNGLTAISVLVALGLSFAAFIFNDIRILRETKQRKIESVARVVGANCISSLDFFDQQTAEETLSSLSHLPNVETALLYDANGVVFATYPSEAKDQIESEPRTFGEDETKLESNFTLVTHAIERAGDKDSSSEIDINDFLNESMIVDFDGELAGGAEEASTGGNADAEEIDARIGTIIIRANNTDIHQQLASYKRAAVAVFALALVVSLVISRAFQQLVTGPIKKLVATAKHIKQHNDFSHRARRESDDEIGVLVDAINEMLGEIEDGRARLEQANDELEQRVKNRTVELEEAVEVAEAANKTKTDFLANMSHEIRTPMGAILGFADLLVEEDQVSEEGRERIETIQKNGKHLLSIINDILDVSKIEAGKLDVETVECPICPLLSEQMSLLRSRANQKGLRLELEYRGAIPEKITTDPTRLRQILVNLIGNAIKFTEQGTVRIVVGMVPMAMDGRSQISFEVIDTGIGLTQDQIASIFEAFTQADETMTRRFGGTGLGLTITRKLAELLGGTIEVESEYGKGSKFRVTIDAGDLQNVSMLKNCNESLFPSTSAKKKPKLDVNVPSLQGRILLVEDGIDNQRLIGFLLKKAGATVVVADNGKIGRDLALDAVQKDEPFHLIFMDMQMPVMDGYEATFQLRDHNYRLPIVALTAHAMSHDRERCLNTGCDDFLTKPVDRQELIERAGHWIDVANELIEQPCSSSN